MKRALSVNNVIDAKFRTMPFGGEWLAGIGSPELSGSWIIYGAPKNGKTSCAMKLAKYLTRFGKVAYNSVEEGLKLSLKNAIIRANMHEVARRFKLLDQENVEEMIERLQKQKSPDIIFIDSVQFLELKFSEYKHLKELFPNKLFIYISHIEGKQPDGQVARRIWRDANVAIRVEGFKAFPVSRYGGGDPVVISPERALEYWGEI